MVSKKVLLMNRYSSSILLSVIVPVYNTENYIEDCIESILAKSDLRIEIIIINDGSTDRSKNIINQISDNRIRVINQENGGLSRARNVGLDAACGEYVIFIDSDDYITSGSLSEMLNIAIEDNLDILQGTYKIVDSRGGRKRSQIRRQTRDFIPIGIAQGVEYFKRGHDCALVWRFMFRKSFLNKNQLRFIEGRKYEDIDFGVRAIYLSKRMRVIDNRFYSYRQTANSITRGIKNKNTCSKNIYDYMVICESIKRFYSEYVDFKHIPIFDNYLGRVIIGAIWMLVKNNVNFYSFFCLHELRDQTLNLLRKKEGVTARICTILLRSENYALLKLCMRIGHLVIKQRW
jgi:glycosyltransferase involved in cell wall biosynthesis